MAPIILRNVTKSYGSTRALDRVSVTFESGVHALLGPNGSGKTTLFRVLLGLTSPDAGTLSMPDGTVGCGFQRPQYFRDLTVAENLRVFASLTDAAADWRETLIERCGLDRVRHRPADDVSAGFRKRLDIALALVDRPDVLLLDEPFADVDEEHRGRIESLLAEYLTDDRTCIVTTHQFDVVASMTDTVTVIADGRVRDRADTAAVGATSDAIAAHYRSVLDDSR